MAEGTENLTVHLPLEVISDLPESQSCRVPRAPTRSQGVSRGEKEAVVSQVKKLGAEQEKAVA